MAIPNANIKVEVPKWKYDDEDEGFVCDDAEFWFGRIYKFVAGTTPGSKAHVTLCGAGEQGWVAVNSGTGGHGGDLCVLRFSGMVGVESGAAFNGGLPLSSDANGRAVAHVAASGTYVVGESRVPSSGFQHRVNMEVHSYNE
jgi:hypothetical protein